MKLHRPLFLFVGLNVASFGQTAIKPKVESVSLFKNGLVVVRASAEVPAAGETIWQEPPQAVHGTFFASGPQGLAIRSTSIETTTPRQSHFRSLQELAGAAVVVTFRRGDTTDTLAGRIPKDEPGSSRWIPSYASTETEEVNRPDLFSSGSPGGRFLTLVNGQGKEILVATDQIVSIACETELGPSKRRVPALAFSATKAGPLQIQYLTRGMAWIPSYEVDVLNDSKLKVRQTALIKNELMDLENVEVEVIAGFPHIKYAHVDSPLMTNTALREFFSQSSRQGGSLPTYAGQASISNYALWSRHREAYFRRIDLGEMAEDVHRQSLGRRTLKAGEALMLEIAQAETDCTRAVEWTAPDKGDGSNRSAESAADDEPWEVLKFANPLSHPFTTAATAVSEGGKFRAQTLSHWAAPKGEITLRVTKALSIAVQRLERAEEGPREEEVIAEHTYRKATIRGEVRLHNSSTRNVIVISHVELSGELLEADGTPEKALRVEEELGVNRKRVLIWNTPLAPGGDATLTYRYTTLAN